MQWFGKAYGAPYESDGEHVDTPIGQACAHCDEAIVEGDEGVLIPYVNEATAPLIDGRPSWALPYHYACHFRRIVGGINHQLGRCICCGGDLPPDPPELTLRKAAEGAVWMFNGWMFDGPGEKDA